MSVETNESPERPQQRITGLLLDFITGEVTHRLGQKHPSFGLKWSPDMPDDDPHAEYLVVDEHGTEYTLVIDVWLHATGKTHQQEGTQ